jgi:hypothetical protein
MLFDPFLDKNPKFLRFLQQIFSLRSRCNVCHVVIDLIAFAPADLEMGRIWRGFWSHGNWKSPKSSLVVPEPDHAVSGTGNNHGRKLQHGIICRCEPTIS